MPINYKDYPPNWKTEIRPAVLKRAGEILHPVTKYIMQEAKCEHCGVENHRLIYRFGKEKGDWELWPEGMESEAWTLDGKKATKIILTIAHLDHDKINHQVKLERLAALCQKCHLGHDIHHHIRNRRNNKNKHNLKLEL